MPQNTITHPHWYSSKTGIYNSIHSPRIRNLPTDPFLDVVSFIFSHPHDGVLALIDHSTGSSISYSKLLPLVKSMASGLQKMGVSKGDVVLLLLPNSIYYPIVLLGVMYLGAIVTTLNPLSSFGEIRKQVNDSGVSIAFTIPENVKKLEPLGMPIIVVPENEKDLKHESFSCFFNLIYGNFDLSHKPVIKQEDTAAILYSSGTTGASKGVVLTHRNFIAMVELYMWFQASQYEYSSSKKVYLAVLPMFHLYGLSHFALGLLSLGSTIVVMRKFDIDEAITAIGKYNVTHFNVVPPIVSALTTKAKGVKGNKLQSLKQVISTAAPLSLGTINDFVQAFPNVDIIQSYGMTESGGIVAQGFNTEKFHNYSSLGLLGPNMEAKVVDCNSGAFLPPGSSGEIWVRGPSIMKGYLNNEEATMSTIDKDGWLHTGDIVYFDQDGYLYLCDRLKDMIKYKGFQIAPGDLEAVLILHPEIVDVAVTGAKDEEAGEIPVAFVVKKAGSLLSPKDVIDYVAKQVAPHKKVRKVVFTDKIPRSTMGKNLRRQLKNYLTSKL
ncbi:4-coumarate--CoA ligase [Trifolium repens]|nr:4-coumarate--CoA ligase [Trifolium repens]